MSKQKSWSKRAQKAHRAKWVAALRSGEYGQTKGRLTNGKGFCCLGVACEISGLGEWVDGAYGAWVYQVNDTDMDAMVLPNAVRNWLGLADSAGDFGDSLNALSALNDDGKKFSTIANIIESEPPGLIANA